MSREDTGTVPVFSLCHWEPVLCKQCKGLRLSSHVQKVSELNNRQTNKHQLYVSQEQDKLGYHGSAVLMSYQTPHPKPWRAWFWVNQLMVQFMCFNSLLPKSSKLLVPILRAVHRGNCWLWLVRWLWWPQSWWLLNIHGTTWVCLFRKLAMKDVL